jgi:alanyl-tRNA synthetase
MITRETQIVWVFNKKSGFLRNTRLYARFSSRVIVMTEFVEAGVEKLSLGANEWPMDKIRQTFIDYFVQKRDHTFWPSSPVVPVNDPTLLFINAGMNQYKSIFLGTCDPSLEMANLKRAVNSQKCIRAGGKHNDLDDVGKDVYHHTFFEMLGNWSFGDFFKEEAITWSWELLTVVYGLEPDRLYATYFGGDEEKGLEPDIESRDIWLKFLPADRVIASSYKDNFWEMGNTGPCGPCSEVHYDRIGGRNAAHLVNQDLPEVLEIWNDVFIQFNRESETVLKSLPAKHVDTGMGLERLASILQKKMSNYDTDVFVPIFDEIQKICQCPPYTGLVGADDKDGKDMAYRVVADHIRTLSFAIADGAMPSAEGRGYVLRRILRRAVRYGNDFLNAPAGFFTKLVPALVKNMPFFPELSAKQDYIEAVLQEEEQSFVRTLEIGVKYFTKVITQLKEDNAKVVPGKDVHFLFTSMGFPVDLTELMAQEHGLEIDQNAFEELMENDRQISAAAELARKGGGDKDLTMVAEQTSWLKNQNVVVTDTDSKYIWNKNVDATITALYTGRGGEGTGFCNQVNVDEGKFGIVLNKTSFYYESGGQVDDTGVITIGGATFKVENCQVYGGYVVHSGTLSSGSISVGDSCVVAVDYERRSFIAPNHTMTHVLNYALRKVLIVDNQDTSKVVVGEIDQKGSLVDEDKLRFDFSWNGSLTADQLKSVENLVNENIKQAVPVYAEVVPLAPAKEIASLRCVFGEKYPDPVRVLSVGCDVQAMLADPKSEKWNNSSIEFCGGTHLTNTKEAEIFVLAEESGIAKGIRRIVAFTRKAAKACKATAEKLSGRVATMVAMEAGPDLNEAQKVFTQDFDRATLSVVDKEEIKNGLAVVIDRLKVWQKAQLAVRVNSLLATAESVANSAKEAGRAVTVFDVEGVDGAVAKKVLDKLKKTYADGSFFMCCLEDSTQKIGVYSLVSAAHVKAGLSGKEWNTHCFGVAGGGKGGGKADGAVGSIPDSDKAMLQKVMEAAKTYGEGKL